MSTEKDMKFDGDKCRLDLIDPAFTEGVGNVLTFGAKKYEAESWKTLEDGLRRYLTATERHILAIKKGEFTDSESGLPHAYHAATDLMMVQWFIDNGKGDREAGMALTNAPQCFGSNPGPQQRAENDCDTCSARKECDEVGDRSKEVKYAVCKRG